MYRENFYLRWLLSIIPTSIKLLILEIDEYVYNKKKILKKLCENLEATHNISSMYGTKVEKMSTLTLSRTYKLNSFKLIALWTTIFIEFGFTAF